MECWTYGCQVGARYVASGNRETYAPAACHAVGAPQVLARLCGRVAMDERVYRAARARFQALLGARFAPHQLRTRLKRLQAANDELAARAARQARQKLPGHETAKGSCVGGSGDVVPEFDLGGCWPLWAQFAPDERRFRCTRTWTSDPAYRDPAVRQHV